MTAAAPPPVSQPEKLTMAEQGIPLDKERVLGGDIEYWNEYYTGKGLQLRQREFAYSCLRNRHTVMVASRQSGKTEIIVAVAAFVLLYSRNETIEAYAPTEKQALQVIFRRLCDLFKSHPDLWEQIDGEPRKSGFIQMRNGNTFRVQTAAKDSNIRGFSPTIVLIDESAFIDDQKYNSDIMASRGSRKGILAGDLRAVKDMEEDEMEAYLSARGKEPKVWEISTPMGRNHFYDITLPGSAATVIWQPHWESPIVPRWIVEQAERDNPERDFQREYCCVFDTDSQYTFPREQVIKACTVDPRLEEGGYHRREGMEYTCGIDLGQKVDHTVFTIIECDGPLRRLVFFHKFDLHLPWHQMVYQMAEFAQKWTPELTYIDRTGPGAPVFEQHFLPYTMTLNWFMEGWEFTTNSKASLIRNLQMLFESDRVLLWDHDNIRKEFFVNIETRMPTSGIPQFPKPKGEKDDIVQSIALACMAATVLRPQDSPSYDADIVSQAVRPTYDHIASGGAGYSHSPGIPNSKTQAGGPASGSPWSAGGRLAPRQLSGSRSMWDGPTKPWKR